VDKFEQWAREVKADHIRCVDIGYKVNRLNEVYKQLGYKELPLVIMGKEIR
jgi:hypothetical protein